MDKPNTEKAETANSYVATDADLPSMLFHQTEARRAWARAKILRTAEEMFDSTTVESVYLLLKAIEMEQDSKP